MRTGPTHLPVALTIAGSDCSSGAGAQADLKAMSALGVYGLTALTCVVAEVPGKVSRIVAMKPEMVIEQVALLLNAFPVAAIKTGMLYSTSIIKALADLLEAEVQAGRKRPLVIDPVLVATSGDALTEEDAPGLYQERLFPLASVVTPNLDEVATLLGRAVHTEEEMMVAGTELMRRHSVPFLIKGGHLRGATALDILYEPDAVNAFTAPYVPGVSTHGTGCTFSAAITAGLAKGLTLSEAVGVAKDYVSSTITNYLAWPDGTGGETHALAHFPSR